jgi:WD40 repeat protein
MPKGSPVMAEAFFSYAREDSAFVHSLATAVAPAVTAWVDTTQIPATAAWRTEIASGISRADVFVFFLTPDSLTSPVCAEELEHAVGLHKRLVPLLLRDVDHQAVPRSLADINWLDGRNDTPATCAAKLVQAVNIDIGHVHGHTDLLVKAQDWESSGADTSRLLRGKELHGAESWLAGSAPERLPSATPSQIRLIVESRRAATRRQRRFVVVTAAVVALLIVLSTVAILQRNEARDQARIASSRLLAQLALTSSGSRIDAAQLYGVAAYKANPEPQTYGALLTVSAASPHFVRARTAPADVVALAGSGDGVVVVAGLSDGTVVRWDTQSGAMAVTKLGAEPVTRVSTDDRGGVIVAIADDRAGVWRGDDDGPLVPLERPGATVTAAAVAPSGGSVVVVRKQAGGQEQVDVLDPTGAVRVTRAFPTGLGYVGFVDDRTLSFADGGIGGWTRLATPDLSTLASGSQPPGATPGDSFVCCGFSTDAGYSAWAKYGKVHLLSQGPGKPTATERSVPVNSPDRLTVSADHKGVAVAGGGGLFVVDVGSAALTELDGPGNVTAVAFLGPGRGQLVSATGATLMLWNLGQASRLTAGPVVPSFTGPQVGSLQAMAFSEDNAQLAVTGPEWFDSNVLITRSSTPEPVSEYFTLPSGGGLPLWLDEGRRLMVLEAGLRASAVVDGRLSPVWQAQARGKPIAARAGSSESEIVVVFDDGRVEVRRLDTGAVVVDHPGGGLYAGFGISDIAYASISPDGRWAATITPDRAVRIVEIETGQVRVVPQKDAAAVAFAADALLVARDSGELDVWDRTGEQLLRTVASTAGYGPAVAPVPGTTHVARINLVGGVEVWDYQAATLLGTFPLAETTVDSPWSQTTLLATPDGSRLATATTSDRIGFWQLGPAELITRACDAAGRNLTQDEWSRYSSAAPPDLSCTA